MAGLIVGHPIDTIKVRQQISCQSVVESVKFVHVQGGRLGTNKLLRKVQLDIA
jgi:hypothetical protein